MKYMTMRAFVVGGYRDLDQPVLLTLNAEPYALVAPIGAEAVRETTPSELAAIARLLPHVELSGRPGDNVAFASPRPAQELSESALTALPDPEQPGATPSTRPTAGGSGDITSAVPAGKAWPKPSQRRHPKGVVPHG